MTAYDTFVGRDADLLTLRREARRARSGEGTTVLVRGPAGIGKTRLLSELAHRCGEDGDVVVWGRCTGDPGAPEHWPWIQVIRECARRVPPERLQERLGIGLGHLARAVPGLTGDAGAHPHMALETRDARFALYDATVSLLRVAAVEAPLVVLLDDVHWADESSLRLLEVLAGAVADVPVLLVAAHRDLEAALDAAVRSRLESLAGRAIAVELRGLSLEATATVMASRAGEPPAARLVADVHALTGGNPLFIDEAVHLLAAGSDLGELETLPRSLVGTVTRVVATLAADQLAVLRAAAVAGSDVDAALVAGMCDSDVRHVAAVLDGLVERGFMRLADQPHHWAFAHALLREAVLADLPDALTATLHARAADVLLAEGDPPRDRLGEVAAHLVAAAHEAPVRRTRRMCRAAGEEATRRLAHGEAVRWFTRALEVAYRDADADDAERLDILLALGGAEVRSGRAAAALATFERARVIATFLGDAVAFARSAVGTAEARSRGPGWEFRLADLRPLLEEALAGLDRESADDPVLLARLLGHLAASLALAGEPDGARRFAARAAHLARSTEDLAARHAALVGQRWALLGAAPLRDKMELTEQLVLLAAQTDDLEGQWRAARWQLYDGLEAGDPQLIGRALATSTRLAESLREPDVLADTLVQQATVAMLEGRFADLAALHVRAREIASGADVAQEPILGQELFASRELGDLQIDLLRLILEANPLPLYHALVCWGSVNLGRFDEARKDLDRFFAEVTLDRLREDVYLPAILAMVAEAVVLTEDVERAAPLRDRLLPIADRCVVAGIGPYVWTGSVHHYVGMLSTVLGHLREATLHLDAALVVHQRMGARPWVLRTRLAQGRLASAAGDELRARTLLDDVEREASDVGMTVVASEAASALQALGGRRAPARTERWTLRRAGSVWRLTTPRQSHDLRDRKGLAYVHELLTHPGREVHVLDLVGGPPQGSAGPVLDRAAKDAYRRRVEDLRDQIDEAEAWGDDERRALAQEELDAIAQQLASALGLAGRDRPTGDTAERARVNVTKAIRSAIGAVAEVAPEVAEHLSVTVRTGVFCAYEPDPASGVTWET